MINNLDIFLIDSEYVKTQSIVMNNVEDKFFRPSIIKTQNIYFQEAVCEDLYKEIIEQFTDYKTALSSGSTEPIDTFVEKRLLDLIDTYAQPIILNYTLYDASLSFDVKITNKGAVRQTSENSESADIGSLRKDWKFTAEHYITSMTKFLVANIKTYPEYESCLCEDVGEKRVSNYSSLYLGEEL